VPASTRGFKKGPLSMRRFLISILRISLFRKQDTVHTQVLLSKRFSQDCQPLHDPTEKMFFFEKVLFFGDLVSWYRLALSIHWISFLPNLCDRRANSGYGFSLNLSPFQVIFEGKVPPEDVFFQVCKTEWHLRMKNRCDFFAPADSPPELCRKDTLF